MTMMEKGKKNRFFIFLFFSCQTISKLLNVLNYKIGAAPRTEFDFYMIFHSASLIHHNRLWTKNVNRGFFTRIFFIFISRHSTSLEMSGKYDVNWRKRAEKYDYRSMLEFVDFSNAPKINITNWMDAIINESKHIFNGKKNGTTFIFPNPFICFYMLRYKRHNKIECILPL